MWFSGLRGAIAFVLALDLPAVHFAEHYRVLVTTTLVIVLFTILFLGGATLPLLKMLRLHVSAADLDFNKTQAVGQGDAAEAYVMQQEDAHISLRDESVFYQWDVTYFTPWLRRKLTRSVCRLHATLAWTQSAVTAVYYIMYLTLSSTPQEIEAHEIEMQQRSSALYAQLDTPLTGHTSDQPPSLPTTPVPHRSPAQGYVHPTPALMTPVAMHFDIQCMTVSNSFDGGCIICDGAVRFSRNMYMRPCS